MVDFIKKHNVIAFYVITFILSFILIGLNLIFINAALYSVIFTQLAPMGAVLLLALFLRDKDILGIIKKQFSKGIKTIWILPAILIPVIVTIISGFYLSGLTYTYQPWNGNGLFYIISGIAMLIGCFAEEIGWRGFMLNQLQIRFSPLISSIIVGICWGVWHLNFTSGLMGFVLYTITVSETSILMTWIFNKSGGDILLMGLYHFVLNLTSSIILFKRFSIRLFIVEIVIYGILCIVIVLKDKGMFFLKPSESESVAKFLSNN